MVNIDATFGHDLFEIAVRYRNLSGVWRDALGLEGYIRDWNVAQMALRREVAAAAVALIYDKHSAGEVASPGGYLRGMVEKAQVGELHLDRSFYGRMGV